MNGSEWSFRVRFFFSAFVFVCFAHFPLSCSAGEARYIAHASFTSFDGSWEKSLQLFAKSDAWIALLS